MNVEGPTPSNEPPGADASTPTRRRRDRVLATPADADLAVLTIEQVRTRRQEAEQEEADLSYQRRMLQGRIDLVAAELRARELRSSTDQSGGSALAAAVVEPAGTTGSDPVAGSAAHAAAPDGERAGARPAGGTDAALVEKLVAVLSDGSTRSTRGLGRHLSVEPSSAESGRRALDRVGLGATATDIATDTDDDLRELLDRLRAYEADVSQLRHTVQRVADDLSAELVRRHRAGLTNIDDLIPRT